MPFSQNFNSTHRTQLGLLASICLFAIFHCSRGFAGAPNILFTIADDWGLHAGVYGTKWVKTPAFDRVAKEGL